MRDHFPHAENGRVPSCPFLTLMRQKPSFSNSDSHSMPRRFVEKVVIGQHFRISIWPTLAFRAASILLRQT